MKSFGFCQEMVYIMTCNCLFVVFFVVVSRRLFHSKGAMRHTFATLCIFIYAGDSIIS